ncbi:hypothetical protein [Duganella vulcania]|uniref:Uncharacterized protein n=1 Tax=Duganella vulcania TaxID=2692166 RepID=A0A845GIK3_9BURK|nr:hypothetical protein [Duganella vulcania]MYM92499.1 hypothetical protein [Duganella vulcania]
MFINVTQLVEETEHEEDAQVAGVYAVHFECDVAGLAIGELVGRALDIFHAHQGIESLDDFDICVLDDDHNILNQTEEYEDGSHADDGMVEKVSGEPIKVQPATNSAARNRS